MTHGGGRSDQPAPVALFVYNRPDHAQRTLAALRANTLASQTDLFVFSDGPKSGLDEADVLAVRNVFENVDGFRSVCVEAAVENKGLAASIISGVTKIVSSYGRVIVIEDDLVTHPSTLDYFDSALRHYEDQAGVFSISAYSHPQDVMSIPSGYDFDTYAIPRMQCWGWATWKDRWEKADFSMADFGAFDSSKSLTDAYGYWIGRDSLTTLRSYMRGEKDVWACRWVYAHFKHHAVCICPTQSLVDNIGLDGSGSNCGPSTSLQNDLDSPPITRWRLPPVAAVDPVIFEAFMNVMDPGLLRGAKLAMTTSQDNGPSFAERVSFWSRHPGKMMGRLKELGTDKFVELFGDASKLPKNVLDAEHEKYAAAPSVPLVRLGTSYGGWCVPETGLGKNDVMVSAGAGEDISFDLELTKRFGCKVVVMDPTPRAVAHFAETKTALEAGRPAAINGSATQFYNAGSEDIDRIEFRPWGLWTENNTLRFFAPENPSHVSHSIGNLHETDDGFEAECVTLAELLAREKLNDVSILKLDIEGAEFDVLDALVKSDLRPKFLLAEFHPGQNTDEQQSRPRTLAMVKRLYAEGYRLVWWRGWDYVLEYQTV